MNRRALFLQKPTRYQCPLEHPFRNSRHANDFIWDRGWKKSEIESINIHNHSRKCSVNRISCSFWSILWSKRTLDLFMRKKSWVWGRPQHSVGPGVSAGGARGEPAGTRKVNVREVRPARHQVTQMEKAHRFPSVTISCALIDTWVTWKRVFFWFCFCF